MCTVTYIPAVGNSNFTLTSNRDEKAFRPTLQPVIAWQNDIKVASPRDEKAGGSWIAINEIGRTCCLLNGAYTAHQKQEHHTRSRGQIVLELASSTQDAEAFFQAAALENVEPFTMVAIDHAHGQFSLSEFVWDGNRKHFRGLNKTSAYIWSSATLYNADAQQVRKSWFDAFIVNSGNDVSSAKILDFHTGNHTDDHSHNLMMEREGGLKTVSVTQVIGQNYTTSMRYIDLLKEQKYQVILALKKRQISDYDLQSFLSNHENKTNDKTLQTE